MRSKGFKLKFRPNHGKISGCEILTWCRYSKILENIKKFPIQDLSISKVDVFFLFLFLFFFKWKFLCVVITTFYNLIHKILYMTNRNMYKWIECKIKFSSLSSLLLQMILILGVHNMDMEKRIFLKPWQQRWLKLNIILCSLLFKFPTWHGIDLANSIFCMQFKKICFCVCWKHFLL